MVNVDIKVEDEWFDYLFFVLLTLASIFLIYSAAKTSMLGEDEGAYFKVANQMLNGTYNGYRFDGTPNPNPILPSAVCSVAMHVLPNELGTCKITTALFAIGTIIFVYLSASKLSSRLGGIFAVCVLLAISYFSHYSLIFYMEIPIAFFAAITVYLALNNNKWWVSILLGIVMGLAYFTKMTALMFPVAVFFYGLLDRKRFKYMLIACIVAGLIWLGFIFYNIQKFDYPLFPIVNKLWKFIDPNVLDPYQTYPWVEEFEAKVNPPIDIIAAFGLFPFLVLLGGLAYSLFGISDNIKGFFKRDEMLVYLMIATFIFAWFFVIGRGVEERYLSVLFPTLVILAAVPFADIAKSNALFLIITLAFCGILLYVAYKGINATSSVARFPENYVKSLEWIKQNTDDDSVIFTVYGGSVYNYGRRERTWLYENFSKVMTSDDSKYILGQLESRDADYILLWGSLIADNYIIPESNIYGVFTWKFVQAVLADSENFPVVFALEDVVVVHVGSVQVNNPPLKCVGLSLKES